MSPPLYDPPPDGEDIEAELAKWFREQQKMVMAHLVPHTGTIPDHFPDLADYDDPMSRSMTPIISAYWQESGEETTGRLREATGLDLEEWRVTNPHLRDKIQQASLNFCKETNATTSLNLNDALQQLRDSLASGMIDHGEAPKLLARRVQEIFHDCETWRAQRIALTEASRAVHAAQLESDEQSGVVAGLEWLLSDDACPLCQMQNRECKRVRLGQDFAVIGNHPDYSRIKHPPLHPSDQCTVVEILKPEYGGPTDVDWGETLIQPRPPKEGEPTSPEPASNPAPTPIPKPKPKPKPVPAETKTPAEIRRDENIARAKVIAANHDVDFMPASPIDAEKRRDAVAFYRSSEKTIYYIPSSPNWSATPEELASQNAGAYFSATHPDHTIHHEIGHALHDRAIGPTAYHKVGRGTPDDALVKIAYEEVSGYAATSEVEFVAEVYAGMNLDKSYGTGVMDLYHKLGGPNL